MAYTQASIRSMENTAIRYGTDAAPGILSKRKEEERIDYVRKNGNPLYKMDQEAAFEYAAGMGMSDTARGVSQAFAGVVGWDEASEYLKKKDDTLRAIFENEEYGTDAMIQFLASAVVLDPVTYLPIVGWMSKGKKAKNIWDLVKYGSASSAIVTGAGYVPEDLPGWFVDKDSSQILKRAENAVFGGLLGGLLTGGGAKLIDEIQIRRGKGSIFKETDEIDGDVLVDANSKDVLPETKNVILGSVVRAPDRLNLGTVINIDDKGIAIVQFVNKKSGKLATKRFHVDDLTTPKDGAPKKPKPKVDETVSRDTETRFIYDTTTNPKQPTYSTGWKNSTYRILREINLKTNKVVPNSWVVFRDTKYKNPMADPSGELPMGPAIKTTELGKFSTLKESKIFVNSKIKRKKPDVIKKVDNDTRDPVIKPKETEKFADGTEPSGFNDPWGSNRHKRSLKNPILQFYQDRAGVHVMNAMNNNVGEMYTGIASGIYGYNTSNDPEATMSEKFGRAMIYAAGGAAIMKSGKFIDGKYNNNGLTEFISRGIKHDYGLIPDYIGKRKKYYLSMNTIAEKFYEIQKKIGKELSLEQNKLLWGLMSGDIRLLDNVDPKILTINEEARLLITKYAQELVDRGLLSKKTFDKNVDVYLKRSYKKYMRGKKGFLSGSQSNSIRIIGDELRPRGLPPEIITLKAFKDPNSKWQKEGWEIMEDATVSKGKVKVRRDWTKEERVEMGEIEDAAYATSETGRLLANDVSAARFFDDLSTDSRFVLDEAGYKALPDDLKTNFIKMPDVQVKETNINKYGKLNGQYVEKNVARDVKAIFNAVGTDDTGGAQAVRAMNVLNIFWKKLKTAYNLGTHVANTVSNVMMIDFADTNIKYLGKAIKEMMKGDNSKFHKQGKIAGIYDANMYVNELSRSGNAMQEAMLRLQKNYSPAGLLGFATDKLKWMKKHSLDAFERAYQFEDSAFRLAVYMDRLDKGFSPEQAALDARRWFIDYDINAPVIKFLKNTVLPFVSYTYRVVPLLAETAALRPHKFAKWSLYGYLINEGSQQWMKDEDDEIARLTMRDKASKQMFGVPFLADTTLRLPFNSVAGDPMFLDVSRWVPGGDIFEQKDTSTAIPLLPAPLQPGGLWYDLGFTLATKTDPFTGNEIKGILPDDGAVTKFGKLLKNYLSKQPPNMPFVPGSYAERKRQKAVRAQERGLHGELYARGSDYVSEYSPWEAIAYGAGIKLRPHNISTGIAVKEIKFKQTIAELNEARQQVISDYKNENIDLEDHDERIAQIDKSIIQISAEYTVWQRKLIEARDKKRNKKERKNKFGGGKVDVTSAIDKPEQRKSKYLDGQPFQTETLQEALTRRRFNQGNIVEEVIEKGENVFDPEGTGYDYTTAKKYNLGPNETGHYPSRVPETGRLLKGIKHDTFNLTRKAEKKMGNEIFKGKDGFYYSLPKDKLGFSNGGEVGGEVLKYIAEARGYEDSTFLQEYADDVKWQESRGKGPKTVQNNNGPARGSYQVEGSEGSSRNETILNRAVKFYKKYPDAPKSKEIQYALEQRGKDLDFSSLSEDTQDALFYMDAERGMLPLDELASGKLDSKTAWVTYWNQDPKALQTINGKENPNFEPEVLQKRLDDWGRAQEEKGAKEEKKAIGFVLKEDTRYLPSNVTERLTEFKSTNGKIYLPKGEADSLNREIKAEKISQDALRNDPHGRGFHGGDPEYDPKPVTSDPAELQGRLGTDEYGTRPTIYRTIDDEKKSAILSDKYNQKKGGQYRGRDGKIIGQFDQGSPAIGGSYRPDSDELLLQSTTDEYGKEVVEPHEYMHRNFGYDKSSLLKGINYVFGNYLTPDQQHEYIDKAFLKEKNKDLERQVSKMSPQQKINYTKYLEAERNKLQKQLDN